MVMKLFMGLMLILVFLVVYPYLMSFLTDNVSGMLNLMNGIKNVDGTPAVSETEQGFWGLFPLLFLIMGVGGIAWLIVRDK